MIPKCAHCSDVEAYGYIIYGRGHVGDDEPFCAECLAKTIFYGSHNEWEEVPWGVTGDPLPQPYFTTEWEDGATYVKYDESSPDLRVQRTYYCGKRDKYINFSYNVLERQ